MPSLSHTGNRPERWSTPRPMRDAGLRRLIHGPIQPMEEPGFLARLFGAR